MTTSLPQFQPIPYFLPFYLTNLLKFKMTKILKYLNLKGPLDMTSITFITAACAVDICQTPMQTMKLSEWLVRRTSKQSFSHYLFSRYLSVHTFLYLFIY